MRTAMSGFDMDRLYSLVTSKIFFNALYHSLFQDLWLYKSYESQREETKGKPQSFKLWKIYNLSFNWLQALCWRTFPLYLHQKFEDSNPVHLGKLWSLFWYFFMSPSFFPFRSALQDLMSEEWKLLVENKSILFQFQIDNHLKEMKSQVNYSEHWVKINMHYLKHPVKMSIIIN